MSDAAPAARGVYKPRRPHASPLFRLVSDHLHRLQTVYDDRFAREYGPWRPVVARVAEKFLACGVLDHGFARIRCDDCAHEYLLAFSCKCRYFCPSCHAKRLAIWTQWLDTTLLAPVPHRQVVFTIPKRLRAYCLYRRRLLGEIARVAARTVTTAIRTLTGERDLAVGIVACLQTHGSRANWHPHLHLLVTDGGFRPDGTFVSWPVHDPERRGGSAGAAGAAGAVARRGPICRPARLRDAAVASAARVPARDRPVTAAVTVVLTPQLTPRHAHIRLRPMYALAILRYRRPFDEVAPHVDAHRAYLKSLHAAGTLLASGPFDPRVGGALLLRIPDDDAIAALDRVRDDDPFTKLSMAQYELLPWNPVIGQDGLDRL